MSNQAYSHETAVTAMIVWEYFLENSESEFHKKIDDLGEGACSNRDFCLSIAENIEAAWHSLSELDRTTFIWLYCDNDCWDWEVVPTICQFIVSHDLLSASGDRLATKLKDKAKRVFTNHSAFKALSLNPSPIDQRFDGEYSSGDRLMYLDFDPEIDGLLDQKRALLFEVRKVYDNVPIELHLKRLN